MGWPPRCVVSWGFVGSELMDGSVLFLPEATSLRYPSSLSYLSGILQFTEGVGVRFDCGHETAIE